MQEDICREVPTQALQVGIMTSSPIGRGPVILSSLSGIKILVQAVRTGNCKYFFTDPTKKLQLVLKSARSALSFKPISD